MSMVPARCGLALLPVLLFTVASGAAEPTAEEIARAIKQLGADDFAVRQKASQLLWHAGRAAEPALEAAVKSDDAEIALRAKVLLDKFRWGIYADTPADVVDLITAYRTADDDAAREKALKELLARGRPGLAAVRKMITADTDPAARDRITRILSTEASSVALALVEEEKYDELEEHLASVAATGDYLASLNYTACLMLRDRVEVTIRKLTPSAHDPAAARTLACLYRVQGDLPAAVKHARKSGDKVLIHTLLFLARDWAALRERIPDNAPPDDEGPIGLRLACELRAGQAEDAARTVAALKEMARLKPSGQTSVWWLAKPLFLNDLAEEAIAVLPHGPHYDMMIDVLAAQTRYREALDLADRVRAKDDQRWFSASLRRARLLHELGERKKAGELLDELVRSIDRAGENWEPRQLCELLTEAGLPDRAFEVLGGFLAKRPERARDGWIWGAVFPEGRDDQAVTWWKFQSARDPNRGVGDTVKALREVMAGGAEPKRWEATFGEAVRWAKALPPAEAEAALTGLAGWCSSLKWPEQERECLQAAAGMGDSAAAWQRLGQHDAGRKMWREAAESFRTAWEKDRTQPAPLWLWGWALEQAGNAKEGARLMDRARWLPLGSDEKRYNLAKAMAQAGRREDERRELDVQHRLSSFNSWYLGDAQDNVAAAAVEKGDYLAAADAAELSMLQVMAKGTSYVHDRAWVTEPERVHWLRGRGLLAAGKPDEAIREARVCLKLLPGDVDVPIEFVPGLEKLGRAREADELFEKVSAVYADLLRDYPNW